MGQITHVVTSPAPARPIRIFKVDEIPEYEATNNVKSEEVDITFILMALYPTFQQKMWLQSEYEFQRSM